MDDRGMDDGRSCDGTETDDRRHDEQNVKKSMRVL
jgi:hypothetical protein